MTVVSEVYILISTERILAEERRRFPGWEPEPPRWDAVRWEFGLENMLETAADFYICPSEAVAEDLIRHWGVRRQTTRVVPYGMSPHWLKLEPLTEPGRILFVGTADLRKGIHYLAMASEELKKRGRKYEFRVAGDVTPQVREQPLCRHLNFLGRVPRHLIHEEFQKADVFVLPSLAEGSAEVTYEALASGVPLVATAAAGSVAREGIEGRIIPERDPVALSDALEQLIENRELRNRMAAAARLRAADYSWERYGERLVEALKHLHS
jgi:glycosyltransferase involved in cell wall biosynthesis